MKRAALLAGLLACANAQAGALAQRFCDLHTELPAAQQSRLLRVADVARQVLQASGARAALVARSGLDLERFGLRYSHAGIGLREGELGAWSVRQLYYACEEGRPRVFDQGLGGFVFGTQDPRAGFLSLLLLPAGLGEALERAVADKPRALGLLAGTYSANAHAHSLQYQNCNQWLVEMLASAWGELPAGPQPRQWAQAWLRQQGYAPEGVNVGSHWLMAAAPLVPWIHLDDHPEADRQALRLRTSLPGDIEAFVRGLAPEVQRIELCHAGERVVVRRGWEPLPADCRAGPGDQVIALD